LTYPLDVVKSTMQADAVEPSKRQYRTILDTFGKLYAENGTKAFFKGITPCLLRSVPANAACFFAYETTKKALSN